MSLISAAPTLKAAMYTAGVSLWPTDVLVTYGLPAFDPFEDVVSFGATTSESDFATLGPRRTREETITQEVLFYCFRFGGQEQEVVVMQRAYELLGQLEQYVRVTDTTLGGTVRSCFLTSHQSDGATTDDVLDKGRMHVLTATFTATNRITS